MAIFDGFLFFIPFLLLFLFLASYSGQPFYDVLRLPNYWYSVNKNRLGFSKPIRISYGKRKAQHLLFIQPESQSLNVRPVILFIHGGGWQFGSPSMFRAHGEVLAKAGYPVYLIGHRKLPFNRVEQILNDVEKAYENCLADIEKRYGKSRKIVVGGMSSGGNLAALLFLKKTNLLGGFFLGAPLDLTKMRLSPHTRLFAGRRRGIWYHKANPKSQINPNDQRPVLVVQGFKDSMVSAAAAISFFNKRHAYSPQNSKLILWPKGNHYKPVSWVYDPGTIRSDLFDWLAQF